MNPAGYQQNALNQGQAGFVQQGVAGQVPVQDRKIYTEQQQVVEPRTFIKEVDVVETRAHMQNIEVLEPQRVMKEVQYTQAVPVTKQIEVVEPQVVMKQVEVIEPRLVTKTIQVVENVPVKKQVEVIESVPRMVEVQTFEPQTFTKQVEVTDYVPVQKQVTVTEPVHLKKQVEFVEPVITTKTITKEMAQPVIIDEKITTTVGPASVIHESETHFVEQFQKLNITEQDRMYRFGEWQRLRGTGYTDADLERHFQTHGWGPIQYYRFHQLGQGYNQQQGQVSQQFQKLNFSEQDRLARYGEWQRLKGTGYTDTDLERHFQTQGWGPIQNYQFSQLGQGYSQQQGQLGRQFQKFNISEQDRLARFNEWQRLRGTGYTDADLERHFQTQGWGPIQNYRFNQLGQGYSQQQSQLGQSSQHHHHHLFGSQHHPSQLSSSQFK